jgi:hypothetical protein
LESQIIAANIASSQFPTVESVSLHILETISLSLSFFSDNDLWLTKKYDPAAHIDRQSSSSTSSSTDFLYFPESFVNAVSSRVLAVGKGENCFEHYEEAKRVFHYKQPFQGLKGGSQLMKNRMKRMENDDKIQKIRFQNLLQKQQQIQQSLSQNEDQIVMMGVEEEKVKENQLHRRSSSLSSSSSTVQNHRNQQPQPEQQSISFMSESRLDFLLDILPLSRDITDHQVQQRPIATTNWNNRNYNERKNVKNDDLEMNDSDGEDPIIEEFFVPG